MPRVDDMLLKTVFYIFPSIEEANEGGDYGASGFFLNISSEVDPGRGYVYAITNSHVIFDGNNDPVLRINTQDGKFDLIKTSQQDWIRHPDGDDIAISLIGPNPEIHDFSTFGEHSVLTNEFIEEHQVGIGDEVIMIGRFRIHAGKKKNLPAAMFGNISMMPYEPIKNPFTGLEQESFLIEMRSIPGNSGSPMVLFIPPLAHRPGIRNLKPEWKYRLLGMCWGQISVPVRGYDNQDNEYRIKIDSAMTAVIPIWKIMEMINGDEQKKYENNLTKEY
jgi:hypothetical protein